MVGEGHLADADDRFEQRDIVADTAAEALDRQLVGAGHRPGAHALGAYRVRLCDEGSRAARHVVGAKQTDDRRHAALYHIGENEFGRTRSKTALASAADDVHMAVYDAGDEDFPRGVDYFQVWQGRLGGKIFTEPGDFVVGYQQGRDAERFRSINVCVFYKYKHFSCLFCFFVFII